MLFYFAFYFCMTIAVCGRIPMPAHAIVFPPCMTKNQLN